MKANDIKVLGSAALLTAAFILTPGALNGFIALTAAHPYLMSFAKFALLATFGECIALRMATGVYNRPGFGLLPRAIIWGLIGFVIKGSFTVYSNGVPRVLVEMGLPIAVDALRSPDFIPHLVMAFAISFFMNMTFAPFFMTLHKITDTHIIRNNGELGCLIKPIPVADILSTTNWNSLWGFVFKKTIPFFWIPAHTITFLLPPHFQVLFAAALGIVLGIILAFASRKN